MLTGVEAETWLVVTVNVRLAAPAETLASTAATPELLLDRVTTAPPEGAGLVSVAVPCDVPPPTLRRGHRRDRRRHDPVRFPTAGHLATRAGTCPGSNESAGRVKSTRTRPRNPYLQGALGSAAMTCARHLPLR